MLKWYGVAATRNMEQTTTGKAPPPIAIPSGGGIQILNMRGPAGIGATVVPQPGSAQTATVVGSPGPPGKGGGVGPRMISFTPQMLANASRPGQPVSFNEQLKKLYKLFYKLLLLSIKS